MVFFQPSASAIYFSYVLWNEGRQLEQGEILPSLSMYEDMVCNSKQTQEIAVARRTVFVARNKISTLIFLEACTALPFHCPLPLEQVHAT